MHYIYLVKFNYFYRLAHIPLNLYYYLLALPEFDSFFSFSTVSQLWVLGRRRSSGPGSYGFDIYHFPRFGIMFPCAVRLQIWFRRTMLSFILVTISVGSVAVFGSYLGYVWAVPRFAYDFVPLLFWCYIAARPVFGPGQQAIDAFAWFL